MGTPTLVALLSTTTILCCKIQFNLEAVLWNVSAGWPATTIQKPAWTAGSRWSTSLEQLMSNYHVPKQSYQLKQYFMTWFAKPLWKNHRRGTLTCRWKLYKKIRCLRNHLRTVVCPIQLCSNSCLCTTTLHRPLEHQWKKKEIRKNMLSSGLKKARHSFSTCLLKYP